MSQEIIKEVARRFREELWDVKNLELADELFAHDSVVQGRVPFTTDFLVGPEAIKQLLFVYLIAFSEVRMKADQIVVEGDTVVTRWTGHGTHTGDLIGMPATGRKTITTGIDWFRVRDGKIVEGWIHWDILGVLNQLGVAPFDGTSWVQTIPK